MVEDTLIWAFLILFIWWLIEWRKNRKSGLKMQKRAKWLLALAVLSFVTASIIAPDETDSANTKQTSKKSSTNKSSQSSSSQKKEKSAKDVDRQVVQEPEGILAFTGKKQLAMGDLDTHKRATYSHIQLQNSDEPKKKRAARLKYNPAGWHNFKFYYGNGSKQAWLMNRGHLIGYQFSGLNDEAKNSVPETAWMNAGDYKGTNSKNKDSMLYYEKRLDSWLSNHPHYWLDYMVKPIYQGDELIPRQVELTYVGLDSDGKVLQIKFDSDKETIDQNGLTHVVLDNVSPNADIDYATGRATNTVKKASVQKAEKAAAEKQQAEEKKRVEQQQAEEKKRAEQQQAEEKKQAEAQQAAASQAAQQAAQVNQNTNNTASTRTVYVTGGGKSNVYWYDLTNLPPKTNRANIVTMTEAEAQAQGKRLSLRQ
ncbi:DNA/RNA non-specific endonuclease [Fructobacillus fructosus]|uniref:DNA/RNA non-specific endonuclease n=1 Tax=Fructobacillus fructosus TaxID=1631 RepID=UPI0002194397|nr:DNA/RNA non-specific endonuclease [Fructobacillus fructosus]KRN52232.1 deoxyribonuclease [Fructobacillus fructosus KCTC 3544]